MTAWSEEYAKLTQAADVNEAQIAEVIIIPLSKNNYVHRTFISIMKLISLHHV